MFLRKLLQNNKILKLKSNCALKRYFSEQGLPYMNERLTSFGPLPEKQPERESVIKALISGNIDADVFCYPEQLSDRSKDFAKWLQPIENYISSCINANQTLNKEEVLNRIRDLEVFRTHVDQHNFGLELLNMESLRLLEVLAAIPWLGTYFIKNHVLPIQLISKYGSIDQKSKYLGKIMNGEIIPTICINDKNNRTNINDIETYVTSEGNCWLLNGEKAFVVNGINSNLFLVFARHESISYVEKPDSFSLLLVEKDFGGVSCKNVYDTIGRHQTPTCTMSFVDTTVPNVNIIGEPGGAFDILMKCLQPVQQNTSAQAISILRNFTNHLIADVLKLKHFDRNLYEFDIVQKYICNIIFSLYTMESMTYLTNGMIDKYENIDVEIEQIITSTYCTNKCLSCIQTGLQLLGAPSYMSNDVYIEALHDAIALATMDSSNINASVYGATRILQYFGKSSYDHIYKKRNSLKHPVYNMLDSIFDKSKVKIASRGYIHPSLQHGVENLEQCIDQLKDGVMSLFVRYGSEVTDKYTDLERVFDLATELYATFANISRASRSYCIGVRNSDIERIISISTSHLARNKLSAIVEDIQHGPLYNGDECFKATMKLVYEKEHYPLQHPLTRTF